MSKRLTSLTLLQYFLKIKLLSQKLTEGNKCHHKRAQCSQRKSYISSVLEYNRCSNIKLNFKEYIKIQNYHIHDVINSFNIHFIHTVFGDL